MQQENVPTSILLRHPNATLIVNNQFEIFPIYDFITVIFAILCKPEESYKY